VRRHRAFKLDRDAPAYRGPYRPYDIVKEGVLALVVIAILTVGLAAMFGSPDEQARTIKEWAIADPTDFIQTAASELDGASETATYGPPYNHGTAYVQKLGPFTLQNILGVRIHVNAAQDYVLAPLQSQPGPPALTRALANYGSASPSRQLAWATAFATSAAHVQFKDDKIVMARGDYGPVLTLMQYETQIARSGALDQALISGRGFYATDYTEPDLFLADGQWFGNLGANQHLGGEQWGMMNETNSYPGQAWLWLYTLLYQIPPYSTTWSANADVTVWFTMILLSGLLMFLPFIPGLRSIPRWTRIYRLIWRTHYREVEVHR
jgi:hypothetical protein